MAAPGIMARRPATRSVGDLTFLEVSQRLKETSILCLPIGAIEQHGPHLPLDTDVVVAEELARRIVARWGQELDLWQLPTVSISLSREHDWAPGTLSLSIQTFVALMRDMARDVARALPARNLAIVNGHGGNRGVLDNLIHELRGDFALNACVLHPFDLSKVEIETRTPDVHGGKGETSVMLALKPQLVRRDLIAPAGAPPAGEAIAALILDRGVSFPWRTNDARLAASGIIGDANAATSELGQAIIDSVIVEAGAALRRLLANQRITPRPLRPPPG
jgi:creatinine amidohydrolase/Fe(II)-dependent formamide hydrolase-like protein